MPQFRKFILFTLLAATVFVWYAVFAESREGLTVYFFDVGQGDSIFIETENGNQIVIDGGPGDAALARLGEVMPFYDRTIDLLVLTHPDADHLNGLVEILGRYTVNNVLVTGVLHNTAAYAEWNRRILQYNIPVHIASVGMVFDAGREAYFEVLSPFTLVSGTESSAMNETSIVLRMEYGENSFLFPGDIEAKTERLLAVLSASALDADIIKAPHHGSKTSSSDEFLEAVTPVAAIISVGKNNRYGHPHAEVLSRYERMGIPVYRTDMRGTITVHCNLQACMIR
jgi:competence protein ComEC